MTKNINLLDKIYLEEKLPPIVNRGVVYANRDIILGAYITARVSSITCSCKFLFTILGDITY